MIRHLIVARYPAAALVVVGLLLICQGCAAPASSASSQSGLPPITRQQVSALKLRQTTIADIIQMFGQPRVSDRVTNEFGSWTWYRYNAAWPAYPGVHYYSLLLEAKDEKCVGYLYVCNSGVNATRVNAALLDQIVVGKSKFHDVVQLLGPPHGRALHGTEIPEMRTGDLKGAVELLAWIEAPPPGAGVKPNEISITVHVVQIGEKLGVLGKSTRSIRMTL